MFARITGAAARGILVALLVATPSFILPANTSSAPEIALLLAIFAGLLTFAEYNSNFPSYIEFRDAPPLNRIRFVSLCAMVLALSLISLHQYQPTTLTRVVTGLGAAVANLIDFPFSPVRLVVQMLPDDMTPFTANAVRVAAGVAYVFGLVAVAVFLLAIRFTGWPTSNGAFNVWVNLPLFDPTAGGDVVHRLQRDGRINVILGVLLPFLIPALVELSQRLVGPMRLADPHTLIWTISAWAFLPSSMIMRGAAMTRIAELIHEKRRRTYANSEVMQAA